MMAQPIGSQRDIEMVVMLTKPCIDISYSR